ncbi:MAG: nucleotidyltransferase [Methylacidiphilales bacterium]|nr:nucleotidyltransferase [Candidatus Methylacidiphilales bacterium]
MKLKSLEAIFRALQEAGARYLVVGGVAVIAHGYVRFTKDLDLVLDLSTDHLRRALAALQSLGYRPIIPVSLLDFADPELRKDWTENRNMKVFNLVSDRYPDVTIDVFPKEPFVFDTEYASAEWKDIAPNVHARVVSVPTLIALKTEANRDQDRIDINKLQKLHPPAP